jgi:hypothetical protein
MSNGESPFLDSEAFEELQESVRTRVRTSQGGILTYFDKWLLDQTFGPEGGAAGPWNETPCVKMLAHRAVKGRFVRFADRTAENLGEVRGNSRVETDIPDYTMRMSQGTQGPVRWRGLPLFKCAFDLALYTHLLDGMRPGSIFEIGSGTWLSTVSPAAKEMISGPGRRRRRFRL